MSLIPSIFGGRRSNISDPFSLDIWDPFSSSLANVPSSASETSAFANTRIDWKETPKAHIFKADLPGIKKEEVKVEVEEGRVLQISGQRSKEQEEKNDKWHRIERSSGTFKRRFRLPEDAKVNEVKASMENGVLTVTVPKMEEKEPKIKSINISERSTRPHLLLRLSARRRSNCTPAQSASTAISLLCRPTAAVTGACRQLHQPVACSSRIRSHRTATPTAAPPLPLVCSVRTARGLMFWPNSGEPNIRTSFVQVQFGVDYP